MPDRPVVWAEWAYSACLAACTGTLRELVLEWCTGLGDGLLAAMPRLARLHLRGCTGFTGAGLVGARAPSGSGRVRLL